MEYVMHLFCDQLRREGPTSIIVHFSAEDDEAEQKERRFKQALNDRRQPPRFYPAAQRPRRLRRLVDVARTESLGG